jgi:hypothetical protein
MSKIIGNPITLGGGGGGEPITGTFNVTNNGYDSGAGEYRVTVTLQKPRKYFVFFPWSIKLTANDYGQIGDYVLVFGTNRLVDFGGMPISGEVVSYNKTSGGVNYANIFDIFPDPSDVEEPPLVVINGTEVLIRPADKVLANGTYRYFAW